LSTSSNGSSYSSGTPSFLGTPTGAGSSPGESPPSGGKKKSRKRKTAPPSQVTPPILAVNPQTSPLLMSGNVGGNMVNMQQPLVQMVTILPGGKQQVVLNSMDATQIQNSMQQFSGLGIGQQMIGSSGQVLSNVPGSGVNINGQIIHNTMNMNTITQNTMRPLLGNQVASLNGTQISLNPNQNSSQVNVIQPVNLFANNGPSTVIQNIPIQQIIQNGTILAMPNLPGVNMMNPMVDGNGLSQDSSLPMQLQMQNINSSNLISPIPVDQSSPNSLALKTSTTRLQVTSSTQSVIQDEPSSPSSSLTPAISSTVEDPSSDSAQSGTMTQ
jgi:hypothetical protein